MNAGAALVVAGAAADLRDGVDRAAGAIASGAAKGALARLVAVSNGNIAGMRP
jgi:anthranilate phosphoribosyltransferase